MKQQSETEMTDHIKITRADGTWVVRAGGAVIGESKRVLELREGDYPPVIYFPKDDLGMAFLEASETVSHCPYKGDASYHSIQTKSTLIKDAGWSYEAPKPGVEAIRGHIAFYPQKATVEKL